MPPCGSTDGGAAAARRPAWAAAMAAGMGGGAVREPRHAHVWRQAPDAINIRQGAKPELRAAPGGRRTKKVKKSNLRSQRPPAAPGSGGRPSAARAP